MIHTAAHPRMDCNWMVKEAAKMRAQVLSARLDGVTGLEARLAIKIAVRFMDWNELRAALKVKA